MARILSKKVNISRPQVSKHFYNSFGTDPSQKLSQAGVDSFRHVAFSQRNLIIRVYVIREITIRLGFLDRSFLDHNRTFVDLSGSIDSTCFDRIFQLFHFALPRTAPECSCIPKLLLSLSTLLGNPGIAKLPYGLRDLLGVDKKAGREARIPLISESRVWSGKWEPRLTAASAARFTDANRHAGPVQKMC